MKVCKTCGVEKPLSEFYAAKNPASSHTGKAWARGECKECLLAKQSAQYTANPEPKREAERRQRESLPAEKRREYNRRYYERHREEIRQRAKEHGWTARWQAANPERRRANEAKRKAVMQQTATGTVDYAAILRTYGYVCHICGGTIDPSEIEFDHVIPLSRGGTHTQDNIRPAHQQCNRRKYNKLLETVEAASAEQLQPIDCTVSSVRETWARMSVFQCIEIVNEKGYVDIDRRFATFMASSLKRPEGKCLQVFAFVVLPTHLIHRNSPQSRDGDDEMHQAVGIANRRFLFA